MKVAPTVEPAAAAVAGIALQEETAANELSLQTYPNPFPEKVKVAFTPAKSQAVTVKVYNNQGLEVVTLYHGEAQAHKAYEVEWQPTAQQPKGMYIVKLQTAGQVKHQKVMLTR